MPKLPEKSPKGQRSMMSFFGVKSSSSTSSTSTKSASTSTSTSTSTIPAKPEQPVFGLGTTTVKKKAKDTNAFVPGKVVQFDADCSTYQVEFADTSNGLPSQSETWTAPQVEWGVLLNNSVGTKLAKYFLADDDAAARTLFVGRVVDVLPTEKGGAGSPLFSIQYEDGDTEDMNRGDLQTAKDLYRQTTLQLSCSKENNKRKGASSTETDSAKKSKSRKQEDSGMTTVSPSRTSRRSRKPICYAEDSNANTIDLETDTEAMDVEEVTSTTKIITPGKRSSAKIALSRPRQKAKPARAVLVDKSDSDFEAPEVDDQDSEEEDFEMGVHQETKKINKRTKRTAPAPSIGSKPPIGKNTTTESYTDLQTELREKLTRVMYAPTNNPQKLPKGGAYVDPVGVDPTHGIVEGILANQVRKVGGLLQLVAQEDPSNRGPGEMDFPIRLSTACSGTDAPSIALGLIQETLDKMVGKDSHDFSYTHEMSCEIEPFKQAYIGRNFPSVPLFPDITKLTASEKVLDVYGRPQTLPDCNCFVAGTSCKDFSMLKTRDRQDIEDKGTSGQTFLGAKEFLDLKKPEVAIFENVDNAPWSKMQEYIRGRIALGQRNDTKAIKDSSKKGDADNELKFSINKKGRYVAEEIPRQVGIRAGAVVQGIVRNGHDATDLESLVAKKSAKGLITLGELAKAHSIDLEGDTLVMETKAQYCTHLCKLDTKEYGLPQTRNRKYLFMWQSDDPEDDLGEYLQEIMESLKTPLLHSMDAFLLPDNHDRIRCFREALRSGPGLLVKRERAKENDFWDWELSHVKDLPNHIGFRKKNGLAEFSRWLTGWSTRGRKKAAPNLWPELLDCWNHRRLDMVDCFAGACVRDAISRDPLHHGFSWDLSQNVTRAPFRSATVGVSGCVTPGAELILPNKGRTLMGYEKLLLQGIPFSRLLLGPESEVQLSDLAGNAMSVPVVAATLLAAICAPQLRRQRIKERNVMLCNFALSQRYGESKGAVLAERGELYNAKRDTVVVSYNDMLLKLMPLAYDAFRASVLCVCETSGTCTKDHQILQCSGCGMNICHSCSSRHQVENHTLEQLDINERSRRPDPHVFERRLRSAAPSILRLGSGSEACLNNGNGLESYKFQLQQVDRKSGFWAMTYGAWEDHGSGRQVAEIRINIGRKGILDSEQGVSSFIRCFAPSIRYDKPHRGRLMDSARLICCQDGGTTRWEVPAPSKKGQLMLVGSDPGQSQRVKIGLNDEAYKSLKNHVVKKAFVPPIQSSNNLTGYHPMWKTWPGTIDISGDANNGQLNGTYTRLTCTHTVVLSALWRRDATPSTPAMYLYLRPDVCRTGLDVAVLSPTPSYKDYMEICELHDWIPENALTPSTHRTKATSLEWKETNALQVEVPSPTETVCKADESFHQRLSHASLRNQNHVLCEMTGLSAGTTRSLLEHNGSIAENDICVLDLTGRSGTRNAKRLSIVAAPRLLKCAAENNLSIEFSKWYRLPSSTDYGRCENNVPHRPLEKWKEFSGRKINFERFYDPEESNDYYKKLLSRPTAFQVDVAKSEGKLIVRMDPSVAAHRAAALLGGGRESESLEVDYCLSELSSMGEPDTKEYQVPNSDSFAEIDIPGLALPLYKRQAKALNRMLAIEKGQVLFTEEERSEHILPGIGWCMISKASRKSPLKGGVLGDAIGSGKTVVTIALILAGASKARARRDINKGQSSATLVVVPPGLVRQWDDERKKFTNNKLKCLVIDCTATLKRYTVEDLCSADMVIVPAGIVEEAPKTGQRRVYTEHLAQKANAEKIPPAPTYYSQREAPTIEGTWVRNMASGPGIYVGNKGNQRVRDAQAYYGYRYSEAISKLRGKTFRASDKGVPIEYFKWERIVVDECHETLVTGKQHETADGEFKAKARRGAREFLGISQTDAAKRPLIATAGVWGLTGTPLLETEARVTELASLMGGTYLTGASHHWRKEERESGRDLFLNQQEGTKSREYRCAVQSACHAYVKEACQRNRGEKLQVSLVREKHVVNMSPIEGKSFLKETTDMDQDFAINPDQLGDKANSLLLITASSSARQEALKSIISSIQKEEPTTKILVFANSSFGGYNRAVAALDDRLKETFGGFCKVDDSATVEEQNETISWFRHEDATQSDRERPRVLLLSFEQAAGHNLQEACHNVIIFDPMYSGTDAVADASTEEQAVGRVFRQGQKSDVTVTRIILRGPKGEPCLDDWIVDRNLDDNVLRAATSNFD